LNARFSPRSPLSKLLPYQADWVTDQSRFKIWNKSRQIGASFCSAGELVRDCLTRRTTWTIISRGERQALEVMHKVREWTRAFSAAEKMFSEERDSSEALLTQSCVEWPNGSRCIAIPSNPDTARGLSTNLFLDEVAFHENPETLWAAVFPSITNELRGQYKVRMASTPNGQRGIFAETWNDRSGAWSRHETTIHSAHADGLKCDIARLRSAMRNPDLWDQEYECKFIDTSSVLLPYDLIAQCESTSATSAIDSDYWGSRMQFDSVCGVDFGRVGNMTVCWTMEKVGEVWVTKEVLCLRNMSTPDQVDFLTNRFARAKRVCVDYTGPGIGFGDEMTKRHGVYDPSKDRYGKVELCTFTNQFKLDLFPALKVAMEKASVLIPSDRNVREDLHMVQRVVTPHGNVTYKAFNSDDESNADRCVALALALRAGSTIGGRSVIPRHFPRAFGGGTREERVIC
jgi:phage FluMu gp28-like protein